MRPGDPEVLAHLGSIQYRMKRYEKAVDLLQKAREADPNCWANADLLAAIKQTLGDSAESQSQTNELIARDRAAGPPR
jgi:Flp pilus assembly protein TadD